MWLKLLLERSRDKKKKKRNQKKIRTGAPGSL